MGSFKELDIEKITHLERQLQSEEKELSSFQGRMGERYQNKYSGADSLVDFVMAVRRRPKPKVKYRWVRVVGGSAR